MTIFLIIGLALIFIVAIAAAVFSCLPTDVYNQLEQRKKNKEP